MRSMKKRKNPHAVALGRKGGKKGGLARAAKMTKEERFKYQQGIGVEVVGPALTYDKTLGQ